MSHLSTSFGTLLEGRLTKQGDKYVVIDSDGTAHDLAPILDMWDGVRVRVVVANLELLAGSAGREMEFVQGMDDKQIDKHLRRK